MAPSANEIGMVVYGITAAIYLYLLVRIAKWRDGIGLLAMRVMFSALFVHSSLSMLIRAYLLSGKPLSDVTLYVLLVQLVQVAAALYMAHIIHKRWPTNKQP